MEADVRADNGYVRHVKRALTLRSTENDGLAACSCTGHQTRTPGSAAPGIAASALAAGAGIYSGPVLDLSSLDLEEIAGALADQTGYEHRWLINPQTGEIVFWTADTVCRAKTRS